ncbi:hypothetical protein O1611_g3742 [Lasiodiplodia mahajangana]|uniref:Uncharacterized protein n=1 Tax=Lasiodiplodia mahajangana TaxID=1108764 RepID=A0ACC2JQW0_9PEZI|nr:hypothetical protein O1611_g3742 [Lasiodiplodia mahajangana]
MTIDRGDDLRRIWQERQEKEKFIVSCAYTLPLDRIVRNEQHLFVKPCYWTECHSHVLDVTCLQQEPIDRYQFPPGPIVGWRIQLFKLPHLYGLEEASEIKRLRTKSTSGAYDLRLATMERLISWKPRLPGSSSSRNRNSEEEHIDSQHKLAVYHVPLIMNYGKREFQIIQNVRLYHYIDTLPHTQDNAWCLIHIDRSQIEVPPKTPLGRINRGILTSFFLAMAQKRLYSLSAREGPNSQQRAVLETPAPVRQDKVRYQILLTDNDASDDFVHLYTAEISDFLLEHFRKPAHLPKIDPPKRISRLMRIHHAPIPFEPTKGFRDRLQGAIVMNANSCDYDPFNRPKRVESKNRRLRGDDLLLRQ